MIEKTYKERFKELLKPIGFKISRKTFFRLINDVIQTIMLVKTRYNCTIGFDITPLSLGITHLDIDGNSISVFREKPFQRWDWKFEPAEIYSSEGHIIFNDGSEEDIVNCMLSIVKTKVLPIFDRAIDSKSALYELEKHEMGIYGQVLPSSSRSTYLTYLKLGDYKKAHEFLSRQIAITEKSIAANIKSRERNDGIIKYDETVEEYQEAAQRRLREKSKELEKLTIPDISYFQKVVSDGERTSLEFLNNLNKKRQS